MKAIHIYRSASKGKVFTREEKIRIINRENTNRKVNAEIRAAVAEEKNRIAAEVEKRRESFRVNNFAIKNPLVQVKGVKKKKDGTIVFQPRNEKGHMMPSIVIP